jgi:hypothetical protein
MAARTRWGRPGWLKLVGLVVGGGFLVGAVAAAATAPLRHTSAVLVTRLPAPVAGPGGGAAGGGGGPSGSGPGGGATGGGGPLATPTGAAGSAAPAAASGANPLAVASEAPGAPTVIPRGQPCRGRAGDARGRCGGGHAGDARRGDDRACAGRGDDAAGRSRAGSGGHLAGAACDRVSRDDGAASSHGRGSADIAPRAVAESTAADAARPSDSHACPARRGRAARRRPSRHRRSRPSQRYWRP